MRRFLVILLKILLLMQGPETAPLAAAAYMDELKEAEA